MAEAPLRVPASEPVVLERTAAVRIFLNDYLFDESACFHASEREQAVGPRIGRIADELNKGIFALLSCLDATFGEGGDDPARVSVIRREF